MNTRFEVHGRNDTRVEVEAAMPDGTVVQGFIPASIIELVPINGGNTLTITRRMPTAEEAASVQALFPIGGVVEMGEFRLVTPPVLA